jgi:hypothetical protein
MAMKGGMKKAEKVGRWLLTTTGWWLTSYVYIVYRGGW